MKKEFREFPVTIYGNLEPYNDVLSKARCRIFYKYGNRNGTYITDEFAEKLISSLSYVPVKGIYDGVDFTDHGSERDEGRIYGIVPESHNFAWEPHLDEDGIERIYACVDVILFTALYKEAAEIVGKSQSMELFDKSLHYHQAIIQGQKWIVFDEGCFLGLQALGDLTEPCFEGASFYSLKESIESIISQINEISATYDNNGGNTEMENLNFKLSDNAKYNAIWSLLNTSYTEEEDWAITYTVVDVYDDFALCYNFEDGNYYRAYYVKNDEDDSLVINELKKVYVMDITEEEKVTVETLRKLNGDTYELVSETLINAQENEEKNSEFSAKIVEMEEVISTLEKEKETFEARLSENQDSLNSMNEELNSLKEYKNQIELAEKESVINEYADQLEEEVLNSYRLKINDFSALELDKELAYELKKTNPSVYAKNPQTGYVPKETPKSGIESILDRYVK